MKPKAEYIHEKNYEFRKYDPTVDSDKKVEIRFRDIRGTVDGVVTTTPELSGEGLYEQVRQQARDQVQRDFVLIFNGRVVQNSPEAIGYGGLCEDAALTCIFAPPAAA